MSINNIKKYLFSISKPLGHIKRSKEKTYTFLLASGLIVIILMVIAVFAIVIINGLPYFWPKKIARIELRDDSEIIGELHGREKIFEKEEYRLRIKIGNRKLNASDFVLLDESEIKKIEYPRDLLVFVRWEWGNAYGYLKDLKYKQFKIELRKIKKERKKLTQYERKVLAKLSNKITKLENKLLKKDLNSAYTNKISARITELKNSYDEKIEYYEDWEQRLKEKIVNIKCANNIDNDFLLYNTIHVNNPNKQNKLIKTGLFFYNFGEFIFSNPRESNTEGGVLPALYGTILLVILMSIIVFPLGVVTAIYLNEYAKKGIIFNIIRLIIFNLAGVPSIVFGVFGLGFFVYGMGGFIDQIFFKELLPVPTFGSGGVLWASLTLAVLTLPVVVVASMEGLKSVPDIYREGAYALSATKWEVIRDVVIPNAMPGMLTGLILAVSRAAGEVAPLMITGVVKSVSSLPVDSSFPFIHFERKFMHLGFHIYDVGFQSPNIEAARPMVFNTTFLLLLIVFCLNLAAIIIRNKMRKKLYRSGV